MDFENAPIVLTTVLFREVRVSMVRGNAVIERLKGEGRIEPVVTSTGRVLLVPSDARVVFEALTG